MGIATEIEQKYLQAEHFVDEGKELAAVQIYKQLIDEGKELRRTVLRLANLYEKMKLFDNVSNLLEEYLINNEDNEVTFLYGQFLIRAKKFDKAAEIFGNLINKTKDEFIDSYYFLGVAFSMLKEIEQSKNNFIYYIKNNGERYLTNAIIDLIQISNSSGDYDTAIEYLELLEKKGNYNKAWLNLSFAEAYFGIGMYYYAQDYILKSLKYDKDNSKALILAARIHMHIGEYDEARKYLNLLVENNITNAEIYALLGFVYIAKKNLDEAKKFFTLGMKENPYDKNVIILKNRLIEIMEKHHWEG